MKKWIALLLCLVALLSLAACGKQNILHCDGCGAEVEASANMDESWTIFCDACDDEVNEMMDEILND